MRDADLDAIEKAYSNRNDEMLANVSARVGIQLTMSGMHDLAKRLGGRIPLRDVLVTIDQAMTDAAGIALHVARRERTDYTTRNAQMLCLAVRHDGALVVGVQALEKATMGVGDAWPELKPWFKEYRRNRARAETWAVAGTGVRFSIIVPTESHAIASNPLDDAALVAALVENPDDLETRLVLADRLLEREDPRGEIIRLDLEARKLDARDPNRRALDEQLEKLHVTYRQRIAGDVASLATESKLAGGFVAHVTMPAPAFKKHGEQMFRAQPIRGLTVRPWSDDAVATLAKCPHLGLVRELTLESPLTGSERAVAIAPLAGVVLERLDELRFERAITTGPDAERFFGELRAPRLRTLRIRSGFLGISAIRGLAGNARLCAQLEEVELRWLPLAFGGMRLDPTRAEALADTAIEALALPNLRSLALDEVWFATDARVAKLVATTPLLESCDVDTLGERSAVALARCTRLRSCVLYQPLPPHLLANLLALPALASLRIVGHAWAPQDVGATVDALLALPPSHPLQHVTSWGPGFERLAERFAQFV